MRFYCLAGPTIDWVDLEGAILVLVKEVEKFILSLVPLLHPCNRSLVPIVAQKLQSKLIEWVEELQSHC